MARRRRDAVAAAAPPEDDPFADVEVGARVMVASGTDGADPRTFPKFPQVSKVGDGAWFERPDPYWEAWMWDSVPLFMPYAEMSDTATDRYGSRNTRRLVAKNPDPSAPDAKRMLSYASRSTRLLKTLAMLDGFHHATTFQLTALSGVSHQAAHKVLKRSWEAGVLQRGRFDHARTGLGKMPYLWKPYDAAVLQAFPSAVGAETAVDMFGRDATPHAAGPHVRHDVLTLEAVLRLLEVGEGWIGVTGEPHATPAVLCPWLSDAPTKLAGDAVLWRDDGLRVILETCASRNLHHVERKMRLWAEWLGSHGRDRTQTVVVFLNAHDDRHTSFANLLARMHEDVISYGGFEIAPGVPAPPDAVERAADAVHLASWEDWFPSGHTISELGQRMTTVNRVRTVKGISTGWSWRQVPLGAAHNDPRPFTASRKVAPPQWLGCPEWIDDLPLNIPPGPGVEEHD